MKKIICLAHDPGGYDALCPLGEIFDEFYCLGPAAQLDKKRGTSEYLACERIRSALVRKEISLLVTATSWGSTFESEMRKLCHEHGVINVTLLDFWSNYRDRFRLADGYFYPDYFIVMDELARADAVADGIPAEITRVLGQPAFDKYLQASKGYRKRSERAGKLLFLSQPLSLSVKEDQGYNEWTVLADCLQAADSFRLSVMVKFHPKDTPEFYAKYKKYEVKGDLFELLSEYDIVIGMNSIALLHACLLGCQAVSYQPNLQGKDYCMTNKLGLTKAVTSYEQLLDELFAIQAGKTGSFRQLQKGNSDEYIWLDGESTARVAEFIKNLL